MPGAGYRSIARAQAFARAKDHAYFHHSLVERQFITCATNVRLIQVLLSIAVWLLLNPRCCPDHSPRRRRRPRSAVAWDVRPPT